MSHMDQNKDIITDIITELVSTSVYQYTSILHMVPQRMWTLHGWCGHYALLMGTLH